MPPTSKTFLHLSQGQLKLFEKCPRQFQYTYLEQLYSPNNQEHEELQNLGSSFHLLMHQQEIGLPVSSFLQADDQLQRWMSNVIEIAPEIVHPNVCGETSRYSEHSRMLQVDDYLLTVIYDLLIVQRNKAQIIDWKTYPKPPNKIYLGQNWQTLLYLYVLVETSHYLPEDICMTYYFVQYLGKPKSINFSYSQTQHKKTEEKLKQLLDKLSECLIKYSQGDMFAQVPEGVKVCKHCQYSTRCRRVAFPQERTIFPGSNAETMISEDYTNLPSIISIEEVTL